MRLLAQAYRLLAEGKDVADVCRELQVSELTYYRWRNQFSGLKANDAKRLKDLERENAPSSAYSRRLNWRRPLMEIAKGNF